MFARLTMVLMFLVIPVLRVAAHQVPSVELEFLHDDSAWRLAGEMDIAYMLPEMRNIPGGPPLSRALAMKAAPEKLARYREETDRTLRKLLRVTFAGRDLRWRIEFPDFEKQPVELPPEAGDVALISVRLVMDVQPGAGELRVHWAGEQETELIILIDEGDDPKITSTLPGGNVLLMSREGGAGSAPVPVEVPATGGWVASGFNHVLPAGYDHILFILGLFLLLPEWKPLLRQSLVFTLAHSVTLALSALGVVTMPEKLVNVMVAVSIAWIGVENLLIREPGKKRMILVFCFGTLHGLGFATGLREKLSVLPPEKLVLPLLGFNGGVEMAQIVVLASSFLLIIPLRPWTREVKAYGSAIVALAGIAWTVERLFFA